MMIVKPFFGPSEREILEKKVIEALTSTGGYIEEEIRRVQHESVRNLMETANPLGVYTFAHNLLQYELLIMQ